MSQGSSSDTVCAAMAGDEMSPCASVSDSTRIRAPCLCNDSSLDEAAGTTHAHTTSSAANAANRMVSVESATANSGRQADSSVSTGSQPRTAKIKPCGREQHTYQYDTPIASKRPAPRAVRSTRQTNAHRRVVFVQARDGPSNRCIAFPMIDIANLLQHPL